jgi:hypothetical protein
MDDVIKSLWSKYIHYLFTSRIHLFRADMSTMYEGPPLSEGRWASCVRGGGVFSWLDARASLGVRGFYDIGVGT